MRKWRSLVQRFASRQYMGCSGVNRFRILLLAAALVMAPRALSAQEIAPGDTLHLRLLDRLASHRHAARVRLLVIAPVVRNGGRVVVAPGSIVTGRITAWGKERFEGKRHWLAFALDSVAIPVDVATGDTIHAAVSTRIVSIDDSRESVDSAGRIVGPPIPSIVRSKRDWAVLLLGIFHPVGAAVLAATLETEVVERHRAVALQKGWELTAVIDRGATLRAWTHWSPPPAITGGWSPQSIAASAPMRAFLQEGRLPADVISLAVVGSSAQVSTAFRTAGWTVAVPLNLRSDFITFAKAAKGEGYNAQPVSRLVLDGRAPDRVYEKVADTFTKRHHFRLWRWPSDSTRDGPSSIWLIAATHDTGIMFSSQLQSYTHRVDPRIDDEREKIVSDLVAANAVAAVSYVPRSIPHDAATVNGRRTPAITDWRMAVIVLGR
jgi:hypothetical protein